MHLSRQTSEPAADGNNVKQQPTGKTKNSKSVGDSKATPAGSVEKEIDVLELQYEWYWSM